MGGVKTTKISAFLIAAAVLGTSVPAFAATPAKGDLPKVSYDMKQDKFCVSEPVMGSLLTARDCRAKQDWAKEGLFVSLRSDTVQLASK